MQEWHQQDWLLGQEGSLHSLPVQKIGYNMSAAAAAAG